MKSIKVSLLFFLLATLVYSIYEFKSPNPDIYIPLNRKQLIKLESGNLLDKIYGINTTFNGIKCRIKYSDNKLIISSKKILHKGFRNLILIPDFKDFTLNIHNRLTHKFEQKNIAFSNYDIGKYLVLPIFSQENVEILKERFEKIDFKINDTLVYKNSKDNLVISDSRGGYFKFKKAIFLKDPVTEKYTALPDIFSKLIRISNTSDDIQKVKKIKNKTPIRKKYSDITYISNSEVNNNTNQLILEQNASLIFSNCKVNLKDLNIISTGVNSIIFYNCDEISLDGVTISNLSEFSSENFNLPSGLTFINSNVKINSCNFLDNLKGDDFINFYHSKFTVENSVFKGVLSDAIDSDFSIGRILNSNFFTIGNDAIDTSGSEIEVSNCLFENVGDKSLSIGEASNVRSISNKYTNNSLAIVLKDGSTLNSQKDFFENNEVDISVYQKKDFYKISSMIIDKELNNLNYLIEKKSLIESLDSIDIKKIKNIEDLMYGKSFGRKTLK